MPEQMPPGWWKDELRDRPDYGLDVDVTKVTTLPELPGYRIVKSLGIVHALEAASWLTAAEKGRAALGTASRTMLQRARDLGGNAVVGVRTATFSARGALTVFEGDAVGVLLTGTVVFVEPVGSVSSAEHATD